MEIGRICVVGAGTMGRGIAHVAALGGFETRLFDPSAAALASALTSIGENLTAGIQINKVTPDQKREALARLRTDSKLESAAKDSDLVIEAAPEDLTLKCGLFRSLGSATPAKCLFATNTSALPIGEMAEASGRPARFLGMHFFNPVHKMKLIEVVRSARTSRETLDAALMVARKMGKETVEVKESPGFVTTRMNALIGNEAFRMLEAGVASAEDIDRAIKLGLNHPMGPFELGDLVGLDVRLSILRYLHRTLGENYRPSPLLERYVSEGKLGRKSGRGVYDYDK